MIDPNNSSYGKKLWLANIVALLFIGSVATLGTLKVQQEFNDQENGSKVINLAGQQRMLSQKISKNALLIQSSLSRDDRKKALLELGKAFLLFTEIHKRLVGFYQSPPNSPLDLSFFNTPAINTQYAQLEPSYKALKESTQQLLKNQQLHNNIELKKKIEIAVVTILNNENDFLKRMDDIVSEYDQNAAKRLAHVQLTSQLIFSLLNADFKRLFYLSSGI